MNKYEDIEVSKKSLKFLYANVRSLVKPGKLDELKCVIKSFSSSLHIIIVTETWIKNEDEAKRLQIPGYYHYYNYRNNKKGGGVSMFVINSLTHNLIENKCCQDNHYLWVHIKNCSLDIGAIYRKPDASNIQNFLDSYSMQLNTIKRGIVFGDFNINLLSSDRSAKLYNEILQESAFKIINKIDNTYCTRETTSVQTIIDHVSSNLQDNEFHLAIIDSPMSDHKQIYFETKRHKPDLKEKVNYEAVDYVRLYKTMKNNKMYNE